MAPIVDKMRENRLRRLMYVLRRKESEAVILVKRNAERKRKYKKRGGDVIKSDMSWVGIIQEDVGDWIKEKCLTEKKKNALTKASLCTTQI